MSGAVNTAKVKLLTEKTAYKWNQCAEFRKIYNLIIKLSLEHCIRRYIIPKALSHSLPLWRDNTMVLKIVSTAVYKITNLIPNASIHTATKLSNGIKCAANSKPLIFLDLFKSYFKNHCDNYSTKLLATGTIFIIQITTEFNCVV